jgi:hypothetical protein
LHDGHKPSFPKRSKFVPQSAHERLVYGEGTEPTSSCRGQLQAVPIGISLAPTLPALPGVNYPELRRSTTIG